MASYLLNFSMKCPLSYEDLLVFASLEILQNVNCLIRPFNKSLHAHFLGCYKNDIMSSKMPNHNDLVSSSARCTGHYRASSLRFGGSLVFQDSAKLAVWKSEIKTFKLPLL